MARARNIKPGFFQNDELAELEPLARLAFIGMWTIADFKGCIEYRPKMLKVQILPYDDVDIDDIVNALELARFIRFYSVQGKRYIKITNFEKHQNPHKNERDAGSEIPDISENDDTHTETSNKNNKLKQNGTKPEFIGTDSEEIGTARADSLLLIPDSLLLIPGKKPDAGKPARFDPLDIELPESIPAQAWQEWIAYRRRRKLTNNEQSIRGQLAKLIELAGAGHKPAEVIKESITSGWQGLFEPKAKQLRPSPHVLPPAGIGAYGVTTPPTHPDAENFEGVM